MQSIKEKQKNTFLELKENQGYKNAMQAPSIEKVVVSTGVGSFSDPKQAEIVEDRLAKITGQKPARKAAKQSIAAFKVREGDLSGFKVTLRGKYMYDFLDKLLTVALPRMKDFRGIPVDSIDEMGNYTLGVREHTIFPETADEELRDVFGMSITIVTTATTAKECEAFLRYLGFPFHKQEENE